MPLIFVVYLWLMVWPQVGHTQTSATDTLDLSAIYSAIMISLDAEMRVNRDSFPQKFNLPRDVTIFVDPVQRDVDGNVTGISEWAGSVIALVTAQGVLADICAPDCRLEPISEVSIEFSRPEYVNDNTVKVTVVVAGVSRLEDGGSWVRTDQYILQRHGSTWAVVSSENIEGAG